MEVVVRRWEYCYLTYEITDVNRPWDVSLHAYLCTEDGAVEMLSVAPWESAPLERAIAFLGWRGWELIFKVGIEESKDEERDIELSHRYYFKREYSEEGKGEHAWWEYGQKLWIVEGGHFAYTPTGKPIRPETDDPKK